MIGSTCLKWQRHQNTKVLLFCGISNDEEITINGYFHKYYLLTNLNNTQRTAQALMETGVRVAKLRLSCGMIAYVSRQRSDSKGAVSVAKN